jgi:hypothetical protein
MSNAYRIGADFIPQLPQSEWSAADKAVSEARSIGKRLQDHVESTFYMPGIGLGKDHFVGLYKTFQKNVETYAGILDRLKYGPALSNPNAVADWKKSMSDIPRWTKEIDDSADFSSFAGMLKDVGTHTAQDIASTAQGIGQSTLTVLKLLPWAIGGVVLLLVGLKVSDFTKRKE